MWLGALSYSLYLWHWPVLAFLRYYTGDQVHSLEVIVLFVLLTFVFSVGSYYGVEQVFRKKPANRKPLQGWAILATGVWATSLTIDKENALFTPEELPIEYRRYADPEAICRERIVGDCLVGDLKSDKGLLVLVDSHAAMLNEFFDNLGRKLGFKAKGITASS